MDSSDTPNAGSPVSFMNSKDLVKSQLVNKIFGKEGFKKEKIIQMIKVCLVLAVFDNTVEPLFGKIPVVFRYIFNFLRKRCNLTYKATKGLIISNKSWRKATVPYILNSQKINKLFDSVEWYVNKSIKEEVSVEKESVFSEDFSKIVASLPENKNTIIKFENLNIHVYSHSKIIDIQSDRIYKRKNRIIELCVYMDDSDERDILALFVEMCKEMHTLHYGKMITNPEIFRNNKKGEWEKSGVHVKRRPETVVLQRGVREKIFNDLDSFIDSENWYIDRDVPYTRRFLFHGCPGSGKTSLIKSMATKYSRNLYFLILSEVESDGQLLKLMADIRFDRSILVIEDIDCASKIVKSREIENQKETVDDNKKDKKSKPASTLTLMGLLNALDGAMMNVHGQIMVMTTNHPEQLDDALIRKGRVDTNVEFSFCDRLQAEDLYVNFFGREELKSSLPEDWPGNVTPAEVAGIMIEYKNDSKMAWEKLKMV